MRAVSLCEPEAQSLSEALSQHAAQVVGYARQTWERIQDLEDDDRALALDQFLEDGGELWRQLHRMVRMSVLMKGRAHLNLEQLEAQEDAVRDLLSRAESMRALWSD